MSQREVLEPGQSVVVPLDELDLWLERHGMRVVRGSLEWQGSTARVEVDVEENEVENGDVATQH